MKLALGAVMGVCLMVSVGCSPSMKSAQTPDQASTTSLTSATVSRPTKLLIPYVNFDALDDDDDDDVTVQTWGAPYQAYEGYDPKLGF